METSANNYSFLFWLICHLCLDVGLYMNNGFVCMKNTF